MSSLKVLHLSGCSKLKSTPNFTRATHLKYLDMDGCSSLSTIHESIGVLSSLTFFSLRKCEKLVSIPNDINSLVSLKTLDLFSCLNLKDLLPRQAYSSHLKFLIFLDLSFCNLQEVPDSIGDFRCLERLNLQGNNFVSIPCFLQSASFSSICKLDYNKTCFAFTCGNRNPVIFGVALTLFVLGIRHFKGGMVKNLLRIQL